MEQDQQEQTNGYINPRYGTKPYEKTRYILQVMPQEIVLVDLGQELLSVELKRFPRDQLEQAKREMVRLGDEDEKAKK